MGISNQMTYDFAAFGNNVVSYVVGIGIGAAALGLLRPIGADWAVRRLCRGMFGDLAHAAGAPVADTRGAFESRMFDRINALFMRLDLMAAEPRAILQASLAALRIGLNILALRNLRLLLPAAAVPPVREALAALAGHFERMRRGRAAEPAAGNTGHRAPGHAGRGRAGGTGPCGGSALQHRDDLAPACRFLRAGGADDAHDFR